MATGLDGCREDSQQLQALREYCSSQQSEALLFCITKPSFAQRLGFAQMQDTGKLQDMGTAKEGKNIQW